MKFQSCSCMKVHFERRRLTHSLDFVKYTNIPGAMSRYIQQRFLGSGSYSTVFLGLDTRTNRSVALKRIAIDEKEGLPATTLREIAILKSLRHSNILRLLDVHLGIAECTIVFEYVKYSLHEYMRTVPHSLSLVKQLVDGVLYIHSRSVIHRDLKPDNILVTENGVLKIADFNLARTATFLQTSLSPEVVTLWYRAPELLKGDTRYSYLVDIWSLGCIIAEMLGAEPLFQGRDVTTQLAEINRLSRDARRLEATLRERVRYFDEDIIQIIVACLEHDTDKRITARNISQKLGSRHA